NYPCVARGGYRVAQSLRIRAAAPACIDHPYISAAGFLIYYVADRSDSIASRAAAFRAAEEFERHQFHMPCHARRALPVVAYRPYRPGHVRAVQVVARALENIFIFVVEIPTVFVV